MPNPICLQSANWLLALLVVATASVFTSGALAGETHPNVGIVHNTKESNSLTYRCERNGQRLKCDFVQTRVRRHSNPEKMKSEIAKARNEFRAQKIEALDDPKACAEFEEVLDVLEGRKSATASKAIQDPRKFAQISPAERDRFRGFYRAFSKFCKSKSEADYLELVRLGQEDEMRTCTVSSDTFTQTFQRAGASSGVWVVESSPSGPCGVVQLSRFEVEDRLYWKYFARKAVTNREGQLFPALTSKDKPMLCKELDEDEYLFDWRSKDHSMGCEVIKFGVF